jgi:hypothetical protein
MAATPFFDSADEFTEYVDAVEGATPAAMGALAALQSQSHIYYGTVDPAVVAHRRKRNKAARKSRRVNR